MRNFDPQLAEIRFGYGLSPVVARPKSLEEMLAGLTQPDTMMQRFPTETFEAFRQRMIAAQDAAQIRKKNRGTEAAAQARKQRNVINAQAREDWVGWLAGTMLRRVHTETGFRERVVAFWSDHFTAHGKRGVVRRATTPYIDDAIRPHIAGRFIDVLEAAVMHPLMLDYLDQARSVGPNSGMALRRKGDAGLNENLAREVLELHTLGVGGPYGQGDVTELAELFTGMTFEARNGYKFRKDFVEPGPETVLGATYADAYNDKPVREVLVALAAHPATARHIATKLAVHFVSDTPDPGLIDALEASYLATDGALMPLYETLLGHASAWDATLANFKPPIDFVSSAMRALAVPSDALEQMTERQVRNILNKPLVVMGQEWERPIGPDGWPEEDPHWVTPQGLAGRVTWAMSVPERVLGTVPDPRGFVDVALGTYANDAVRFAAGAAESKPEAIGLVLMSPAFQRR